MAIGGDFEKIRAQFTFSRHSEVEEDCGIVIDLEYKDLHVNTYCFRAL